MFLFKSYLPWVSLIAFDYSSVTYLTFRLFLCERKERGNRSWQEIDQCK